MELNNLTVIQPFIPTLPQPIIDALEAEGFMLVHWYVSVETPCLYEIILCDEATTEPTLQSYSLNILRQVTPSRWWSLSSFGPNLGRERAMKLAKAVAGVNLKI